jgi:hypothetical protein
MDVLDTSVFEDAQQARQDEHLLVKFTLETKPDAAATLEQGRAIFKEVEYIHIQAPGSRNAVARPARPGDKERFPRHYEAFKRRIEMPMEGTPLTEWPLMSRSLVEELAYLGIKTVEQLANVSDTHISGKMGFANFKRQAQEWLEYADADAPSTKLVGQVEALEAQLAARDQTIEQLSRRLDELERAPPVSAAPAVESSAPSAVPTSDLHSALDEPAGEPSKPRRRRRTPKE